MSITYATKANVAYLKRLVSSKNILKTFFAILDNTYNGKIG